MAIIQKVQLVEELFEALENEIASFKNHTKLDCIAGCGNCCNNAKVDASPLEFFPWAFHLFLNGQAQNTIEALQNTTDARCFMFKALSFTDVRAGKCTDYKYRGLICRLFGFSANRDKYGQMRMATCARIKEEQKQQFTEAEIAISNGLYLPVFSDYYTKLSSIDARLGKDLYPINQALQIALEEILHYYAYRPFPDGLKDSA